MSGRVAVVGATSYVGSYVIDALVSQGREVIAVTRSPDVARMLLGERPKHVHITSMTDASEQFTAGIEAVINLAYIKTAPLHRVVAENEALMQSVHRLATALRTPRLLHASTIAVFGYRISVSPRPLESPRLTGDAYIETKSQAEHTLRALSRRANYALGIVRLGNVIGPGSPAWTASMAQRLVDGRPIADTGGFGYSNSTYVENVGSYFAHLTAEPVDRLRDFGAYHHLVEFGHKSWAEVMRPLERATGLASSTLEPARGESAQRWLSVVAKQLRTFYRGRGGSMTRRMLARLPAWAGFELLLSRLKSEQNPWAHIVQIAPEPDDRGFLDIVGSPMPVPTWVLPNWTPLRTFDEAMAAIERWAHAAGFSILPAIVP